MSIQETRCLLSELYATTNYEVIYKGKQFKRRLRTMKLVRVF